MLREKFVQIELSFNCLLKMDTNLEAGSTQREDSWFLFSYMDLNLLHAPEQAKHVHTYILKPKKKGQPILGDSDIFICTFNSTQY